MNKGTPTQRIAWAAIKAFVGAFGAIIVVKLEAGATVWTWQEWKPILISAAVAGILAVWKWANIKKEAKRS